MTTASRTPYRFVDNAHTQTNDFGNHILRKGAGEMRKPSWQRTETVVRILPCWNFETNTWEPFRRSDVPMDFGDWIRRYECVKSFGDIPSVTLILYDPMTQPNYDIQTNPCVILYRAISQSIDARQCEPEWPALLKGGQGRSPALSRHSPLYLTRVGVFRIKSKDMATSDRAPLGLAPGDAPFFFQWPKTAGEKLCVMLDEPVDDPKGIAEDDWPALYKHGDIVSLNHGAYVHIYEEGADPRQNSAQYAPGQARSISVAGGRGGLGGNGGGKSFNGYDMFFSKTFNGFAAELSSPELERLVKSKQRPWDECLQFLNHQEQAFLVQDGFPPRAILYAWKDHPEWIKDETRSRAVSRVAVQVPAQPEPRASRPIDQIGLPRSEELVEFPPATPQGNVGGWGTTPNQDGERASTDTVVPKPLEEQGSAITTREAKALEALAAAKARNAGRMTTSV